MDKTVMTHCRGCVNLRSQCSVLAFFCGPSTCLPDLAAWTRWSILFEGFFFFLRLGCVEDEAVLAVWPGSENGGKGSPGQGRHKIRGRTKYTWTESIIQNPARFTFETVPVTKWCFDIACIFFSMLTNFPPLNVASFMPEKACWCQYFPKAHVTVFYFKIDRILQQPSAQQTGCCLFIYK